ncbi:MAG: hypothetical protein QXO55_07995 [Candidatus Korarchaeum sp.]
MLKGRALAFVLILAIAPQLASAQNVKLWASKSYVTMDEGIELNLLWSDFGCPEYHVVLLRTYPNGTTLRYPAEGYGEPLKAPGVTPMRLKLEGERAGKHKFKYELYCGTSHAATSNEVEVIVSRGSSSLELRASPERLLMGEEVELSGFVSPRVSGKVSLEVISPSGSSRDIALHLDGNFSYRLVLNESGTWRFRASWSGNIDYLGASSDWITVEVSEKPIIVQVRTDPPGLRVYVDGGAYEGGGDFEWVKGSSHNLSADAVITSDGVRYVFTGWRGKGSSRNLSLRVERPEVCVAEYKVQYYLNVTSELGEVEGSGWYDAGSYARAILKQGKLEGDFPWVYVFSGWEGDAEGKGLASEPILMDRPKSAVARWERRMEPYGLALIIATALASLFGALSLYLLYKYRWVRRERPRAGVDEERVRRVRERIARLEEMRKRGEVPERVYRRLKEEYSRELRRAKEGR